MTDLPIILTIDETAALLKCSERTVRAMIQDGRIPKSCVVYIGIKDKRINITKYLDLKQAPTPLHPPVTAADVERIVTDALARVFRLDRAS